MNECHNVCSLYLISPPKLTLAEFRPRLEEALAAGSVPVFQLRLKEAEDKDILKVGEALLPVCWAHGCILIVNDRPDLAKQLGADGAHLGQDDLVEWPVEKARDIMGEGAAIGVSCHASRHLAMEAAEKGADYVAFGAFYPTRSKPREKIAKWGVPQPEILEWWRAAATVPSVAIGGITSENAAPLVKTGADFLAVITSVWENPKGPGDAISSFKRILS